MPVVRLQKSVFFFFSTVPSSLPRFLRRTSMYVYPTRPSPNKQKNNIVYTTHSRKSRTPWDMRAILLISVGSINYFQTFVHNRYSLFPSVSPRFARNDTSYSPRTLHVFKRFWFFIRVQNNQCVQFSVHQVWVMFWRVTLGVSRRGVVHSRSNQTKFYNITLAACVPSKRIHYCLFFPAAL